MASILRMQCILLDGKLRAAVSFAAKSPWLIYQNSILPAHRTMFRCYGQACVVQAPDADLQVQSSMP